jgi:transposase-like protein
VDVSLSSGGLAISNTLEFLLSVTRDAEAAKGFFAKTLAAPHSTTPLVINVDKNAAYPKAFKELKDEGALPDSCELTSASSPSTTLSNKTTASSNDASNPGWASFRSRPHGAHYKDMRV